MYKGVRAEIGGRNRYFKKSTIGFMCVYVIDFNKIYDFRELTK